MVSRGNPSLKGTEGLIGGIGRPSIGGTAGGPKGAGVGVLSNGAAPFGPTLCRRLRSSLSGRGQGRRALGPTAGAARRTPPVLGPVGWQQSVNISAHIMVSVFSHLYSHHSLPNMLRL